MNLVAAAAYVWVLLIAPAGQKPAPVATFPTYKECITSVMEKSSTYTEEQIVNDVKLGAIACIRVEQTQVKPDSKAGEESE